MHFDHMIRKLEEAAANYKEKKKSSEKCAKCEARARAHTTTHCEGKERSFQIHTRCDNLHTQWMRID
jgi:hypothetical protein